MSANIKLTQSKSIQFFFMASYFFLWYKLDCIETTFRKNVQKRIKNILYVHKEYPFSLWKMFLGICRHQRLKGTVFLILM